MLSGDEGMEESIEGGDSLLGVQSQDHLQQVHHAVTVRLLRQEGEEEQGPEEEGGQDGKRGGRGRINGRNVDRGKVVGRGEGRAGEKDE